jgi:hypothetical protein
LLARIPRYLAFTQRLVGAMMFCVSPNKVEKPTTGITGCCARGERPRLRRAAEQRYELTSLHVGRAALVIRLTGRGVRLIGSK